MGACHQPHHVAAIVDAGEGRGEASPAVSINEPSLEAALISCCMGAFHNGAFVNSVNPNWIFGFKPDDTLRKQMYQMKWKRVTSCVG